MGNDTSKSSTQKTKIVDTIFNNPSENTRKYAEKCLSTIFSFAARDVKIVIKLSQVNQTFNGLFKKDNCPNLDRMWKALTHDPTPAAIHKIPSCRLRHTAHSSHKTLQSSDPYQNASPKQQNIPERFSGSGNPGIPLVAVESDDDDDSSSDSVDSSKDINKNKNSFMEKSTGIGGNSMFLEVDKHQFPRSPSTEEAPEETQTQTGKLIGEDFIKICRATEKSPSLIWLVEKLIYRGKIDLNYKSVKTMNTALITAVETGNVGIVPTLVTAGARVNKHGGHGKTPLLAACERGDTMLAKFLLKHHADPLAHDSLGTTCVQAAMMNDLTGELLDALLATKKIDINASLSSLNTKKSLTKANLSSSQRPPNQQEQQSSIDEKIARPSFGFGPPLLEACRRGASIENIKVILKHGADVNVHQTSNHVSALLTAVKSGRTDIAKLLIEAGANVNSVSASSLNGTTPLMAACVTGDLESCRLLVEKGKAHLNVRDANGNSAIMLARHHDCPDIVEYLRSKGATE